MRTNKAVGYSATTHEGGRADAHQKPLEELERAVSTCLLWENTFYETGNDIAARIADLCHHVSNEEISALAVKARIDLKLRHVPLYLVKQLLKKKAGSIAGETIASVVRRPDEMGELISLYWEGKRHPLAAQLKKGLAKAFSMFSAYQLAKWNGDAAVKLKDVMFLTHPKPRNPEQAEVWKKLIAGTLESPDTWEVALSAGKDKKETWERLITEGNLGYIALLMNLRNMSEAQVNPMLVEAALRDGAVKSMALPFRFISACKHAPQYTQALSDAMESVVAHEAKLEGATALVIDVSGSMNAALSSKGALLRYEAAAALAILVRGITPSCRLFAYSSHCREIQNIRGLGLLGLITGNIAGSTETKKALKYVEAICPNLHRVILITDEQANDGIHELWCPRGYIVNVAPYKPSLETNGKWKRINGWSERIVDWIRLNEKGD